MAQAIKPGQIPPQICPTPTPSISPDSERNLNHLSTFAPTQSQPSAKIHTSPHPSLALQSSVGNLHQVTYPVDFSDSSTFKAARTFSTISPPETNKLKTKCATPNTTV
ncbi:hypothetical protein ASPCAL05335 [Aspergillus calidoustus]|uniref:Uncharacterized protein n=1 Tax=Aspergillus calidoustus TaxID=454130 RepID=A0A0U5C6R6_ASPCI|nr:hypothetical protein ASPCAL05335 [Aspergillus calidoustus]